MSLVDIRRDFFMGVGYGSIPGFRRITALGNNPDVDTTGTPEDIWPAGGPYPFMTSATALEVVSSSVADDAAGTGGRTIIVFGLDADYNELSQTVTMDGTTPVVIPTSLIAINSAVLSTAGSGNTNAGDITIRDSGGGTTRAFITAGLGITTQCIYTVPAGHTLQIHSSFFCFNRLSASSRFASFATFIRSPTGLYRMPFELTIGDEPPYRHDGIPGIVVSEKNSFSWRCTFVSNDNANLTAAFLAVLKENSVG